MKLKVVKAFIDKTANVTRNIGDTFEVNAKRGSELLAHELNLVELIEEKAGESEKAKPVKKARKTNK